MTKHTPGPWRIVERKDGLVNIYAGATEVALCVRPKDARLIAAAPKMLDALEATDIALTNTLQVFGERALSDSARTKVAITRDRIRVLLARIEGVD
jgi:hypothetical protein